MTDDQPTDSDTGQLTDLFEQYRDDETTGYGPACFGQVGTGKTARLAALEAAIHESDAEREWFDPKDDPEDIDTNEGSENA